MRAIEIMQETGPESALRAVEIEPPTVLRATDGSESEEAVLFEVAATGASFPELLQTRGLYQLRPQLPFVPGCEVSGIVVSAPESEAARAFKAVAASVSAQISASPVSSGPRIVIE
jgi:NADPH2:quinone reductase